jgi:F-type H+-transporting ATPase subunit delta
MIETTTTPKIRETVLDVTEERIARTYADSLLGAAVAGGVLDQAAGELEAIGEQVLPAHPQLTQMLGSAFLGNEERVAVLDRIFGGKVSPLVLNFLKVLSAHNRVGILPTVIREVRKQFNSRKGLVEVEVRSATPISAAMQNELTSALVSRLGINPVLSVSVDPELIGGMELRVGDTVYDGTLRTAFDKAHKAIVAQTVEAIETNPDKFFRNN